MTRLERHLYEALCDVMDYLGPGKSKITKEQYPDLMNRLRKAKFHAEQMNLVETSKTTWQPKNFF
jgi:hypothetical protein